MSHIYSVMMSLNTSLNLQTMSSCQIKKSDPYLAIEFPVILRLLYSCGLRIGETVRINLADTDLENGILRLINTKGDKQRLVPMSSGIVYYA